MIYLQKHARYILKKNCPNIGKEIGDYYSFEYTNSIEELIANGVIEKIMEEPMKSMEEKLADDEPAF